MLEKQLDMSPEPGKNFNEVDSSLLPITSKLFEKKVIMACISWFKTRI